MENNILNYCAELAGKPSKDCSDYAIDLQRKFGGAVLCIKSVGSCFLNFIKIPVKGDLNDVREYTHHFIVVINGRVYDVLCGNINVDLAEYLDCVSYVTHNKLRYDRSLSFNYTPEDIKYLM